MAEQTREFKLPDLGEGLTEAEIVQWLVKEGDTIELNQPIVEVETEKALVEIPSPFAGTVDKLFGDVGERVAVGSPLLVVKTGEDAPQTGRKEMLVGYGPEEGGGKRRKDRKIGRRNEGDTAVRAAEEDAAAAETEPRGEVQAATSIPEPPQVETEEPVKRALATPPVRKLARDLGVDIDAIEGSGPDGRVTREDVQAAAERAKSAPAAAAPAAAPAASAAPAAPAREADVVPLQPVQRRAVAAGEEEERIPVRAIRRSIAEKMVKSAFTIPHVTEWLEVDATELMQLREQLKGAPESETVKVSPLPLVVKSLLAALKKFPLINSSWDDETNEIVVKHRYHIGIATDTERGLLVPVVKDADQLNVFEIASEIQRLVTAARDGKIGPADLTGSTITVTSIGSFGMQSGTPIINYPECAILAPGVIRKKPWVVGDQVVPRDVMTLALTFDHRIVDGALAGRFLRHLGDLIESPARLLAAL